MAEPNAAGHVASLDEIKGHSGIEFLKRIASGDVAQPPITKTLGFALTEVAPGFALFTYEVDPQQVVVFQRSVNPRLDGHVSVLPLGVKEMSAQFPRPRPGRHRPRPTTGRWRRRPRQ